MTTLIGYRNYIDVGSLTTNSAGKPISNLKLPTGDPKSSWETQPGVTEAYFTITPGGVTSWRAFILARTNLTPAAEIRWSVGTAAAVIPAIPTVALDFKEGYVRPVTGTYSFTRASTAWRRKPDLTWEEVGANIEAIHHDEAGVCLGYLKAPQIINGIRNARLEGGAAGTPGTAPTNCSQAPGGFSTRIAAADGTEDGLPCMDWEVTGSPVGATNCVFWLETATSIAAVQNDVVDVQLYARIIAGDLTNISTLRLGFSEYDAGGTFLGSSPTAIISLNELRLGLQRVDAQLTVVSATAAWVRPFFQAVTTTGGTANVTFRFGPPLCRKNASVAMAVFPVTPPVGAPASYTRQADLAVYTPAENIMVSDAMTVYLQSALLSNTGSVGGAAAGTFRFDDGSLNNLILLRQWLSGGVTVSDWTGYNSGALVIDTSNRSFSGTGLQRHVARLSPDVGFVRWAGTVGTDSDIDRPTTDLTRITLGGGLSVTIDTIRELRIYNKKLVDGQCAQLANDGTSYSQAGGLAFTSGWIPASVDTDYGQTVCVVAPTNIVSGFGRCDIRDPANPEQVLRVGLAYAGEAWQPAAGVSWETQYNPLTTDKTLSTRGGQDYVEFLFRRRGWQVDFNALANDDAWTRKRELEASADAGFNVLFVPEVDQEPSRSPVLGIWRASGALGHPGHEHELRSWSATITERL